MRIVCTVSRRRTRCLRDRDEFAYSCRRHIWCSRFAPWNATTLYDPKTGGEWPALLLDMSREARVNETSRECSERVLVIYTSLHAQTKTIATELADRLRRGGVDCELADAESGTIPDIAGYDAVVIGSSLRFGRHPASVLDFVARVRDRLAMMPAFFFSIARDDNGGIAQATGWQPTRSVVFDRRTVDRRRFQHRLGGTMPSRDALALAESSGIMALAGAIQMEILRGAQQRHGVSAAGAQDRPRSAR